MQVHHWGAAQWLLLSAWLLFSTVPPIAHFTTREDERGSTATFLGFQASKLAKRAVLFGILLWGGFF